MFNFFLDRLELKVNQENIHVTLTILKVVLALKVLHVFFKNSKKVNGIELFEYFLHL